MRIGIYDIDSKMKADNRGPKRKYPNVACGKIYGYHKMNGDEVVYPWKGEKVDKLYISTIFTSTKAAILRQMPIFESQAKEVLIGGSGWDDYSKKQITKLPPEIDRFNDPKWLYEMYDLDYGIGFSTRGCHVGCGFCMVWRKEGLVEYSDTPVSKLVNPKMKHLILMNNNSLAHDSFWEDVAEIKFRGLSIHWDQANDITLVTPKIAEALASVNYRSFDGKDRELVFAFDLLRKRKAVVMETASNNVLNALDITRQSGTFFTGDGSALQMGKQYENEYGDTWFKAKQVENKLTRKLETMLTVEYDMMKVVPRKIKLMQEYGINPKHLMFYVLIGFNSTEAEDLARIDILKEFKSRPYPMLFRDLTGKVDVDGNGNPQPFHARPFRDWVTQGLYKKTPFHEFDRYPLRKEQFKQKQKEKEKLDAAAADQVEWNLA